MIYIALMFLPVINIVDSWVGHFLSLCGKVAIVWSFGVDTSIISFCFGRVVEDREGHFYLEEFESIVVSGRSLQQQQKITRRDGTGLL
jgi:hypothetical protein